MDATEFATHDDASIMEPAEPVSGMEGGLPGGRRARPHEVWVNGPHGYFKVSGQSKDSDIALAKAAAARN